MSDTTQSISQSIQRFLSGTILSRITGLVRDVAMAFAFGTNEAISAFLIAFRFSQLPRRLLGEGALHAAFIPQFEEVRQEQAQEAYSFFGNLCITLSLVLLTLILLICLGLGGWLAFGNVSPNNRDIILLTIIMAPGLLFICLYGLYAAFLQCEGYYFIPGFAPVAFNVVWTISIVCLWKYTPAEAMPWLGMSIVLACLGQWLMTVPTTIRILRAQKAHKYWKNFDLRSPLLIKLGKALVLSIIGVGASQINNALDPLFARYADLEGPAYLWYSLRIQQLPLALFGVALSGALFPPLTRAIKSHDIPNFIVFLNFAIRSCFAFLLPITIALFVLGHDCINVIYYRGDFTTHSMLGTTQCLWAYAIGLVPMAIVLVLAPAFYAQNNYRIPIIASFLCMGLNVILNGIFVAFLGLGAASVALATSLAAWFNIIFLGIALYKMIGQNVFIPSLYINIGKVATASLISAGFVLILGYFFWQDKVLGSIIQSTFTPDTALIAPQNFFYQCLQLICQGTAFIGIFVFVGWILKSEDILKMLQHFIPKRIKCNTH